MVQHIVPIGGVSFQALKFEITLEGLLSDQSVLEGSLQIVRGDDFFLLPDEFGNGLTLADKLDLRHFLVFIRVRKKLFQSNRLIICQR